MLKAFVATKSIGSLGTEAASKVIVPHCAHAQV